MGEDGRPTKTGYLSIKTYDLISLDDVCTE